VHWQSTIKNLGKLVQATDGFSTFVKKFNSAALQVVYSLIQADQSFYHKNNFLISEKLFSEVLEPLK